MPTLETLQHRKAAKRARLKRQRKGSRSYRRILRALKRIAVAIRRKKAHVAKPFAMYDNVTVSLLPDEPGAAYAAYVNGAYRNYAEIVRAFPHAKVLSIAVTSSEDAECLDVEPGDATNGDAPAWVKRQHARGIQRPVVYTSISNARSLLGVLMEANIGRDSVRLWTAHYTHKAHLCDASCGFGALQADATQFTDHSHGRSLDESLCAPDFL